MVLYVWLGDTIWNNDDSSMTRIYTHHIAFQIKHVLFVANIQFTVDWVNGLVLKQATIGTNHASLQGYKYLTPSHVGIRGNKVNIFCHHVLKFIQWFVTKKVSIHSLERWWNIRNVHRSHSLGKYRINNMQHHPGCLHWVSQNTSQ